MKISTKRKLPLYQFLNICLLLLVSIGLFILLIDNFIFDFFGGMSYLLLLLGLLLALFLYSRGHQIFEYDSDGESLTITNKSLTPILFKTRRHEFPKYKLLNYNIINVILYQRLYITITHRSGNSLVLKYDISTLSKKEISDLRQSLSRSIKNNLEKSAKNSQEIE